MKWLKHKKNECNIKHGLQLKESSQLSSKVLHESQRFP